MYRVYVYDMSRDRSSLEAALPYVFLYVSRLSVVIDCLMSESVTALHSAPRVRRVPRCRVRRPDAGARPEAERVCGSAMRRRRRRRRLRDFIRKYISAIGLL